MKRKSTLLFVLMGSMLIGGCTNGNNQITPSAQVDTPTPSAILDSTSNDQIQKMMGLLEQRVDEPTGFQVIYYQPNTNDMAFENFYKRPQQADIELAQQHYNVDTMIEDQQLLVEKEMVTFNHDLLSILKEISYMADTDGEASKNKVVHIFNLANTDDNTIAFDIYDDGSIRLTLDGLITHAAISNEDVQSFVQLFEPLVETYSGKQFH